MNSPVDEIKSRLDIVEVIKQYTQLKQVGVNWKALCPFHSEKTPSFIVSPEKQVWHCFGCGAGGDLFTFIEQVENVDFVEALRILAQQANVELKDFSKQEQSQRNRLLDLHCQAADFWHQRLFSETGESARNYLKKRGISKDTVITWQIGYALESWDSLFNFLKKKGYQEREIISAGLVVTGERAGRIYDRFRDRVIFPLRDHNGQVVGFSARTLGQDSQAAKYINSPQTLIYDKSRLVFGLDKAKAAIKAQGKVVLVEGQLDVISSHQAGIEHVVASSGTALTKEQLTLLKRYTDVLVAAFDQDSAGIKALERSIWLALQQGFTVQVAVLPIGEDPDSLIQKDVDHWRTTIVRAENYIEYYFHQVEKNYDLQSVQGKKQAAKVILGVLAQLPDKVEQAVYLQKLSGLLHVSDEVLKQALPQTSASVKQINQTPRFSLTQLSSQEQWLRRAERLLACLLAEPEQIGLAVEEMPENIWQEGSAKNLYRALISFYTNHSQADSNQGKSKFVFDWYKQFEQAVIASGDKKLVDFMTTVKMLSDDLLANEVQIDRETHSQLKALKRRWLQDRISGLQDRLANSNNEDLLIELNKLIQQLAKLDKN